MTSMPIGIIEAAVAPHPRVTVPAVPWANLMPWKRAIGEMAVMSRIAKPLAIDAKDQTAHWRRLFWQPARTKKELSRRERLWFWWGSTGWFAELAARGVTISAEKSFVRGD